MTQQPSIGLVHYQSSTPPRSTGPAHYAAAELLIDAARNEENPLGAAFALTEAQVHATLALAAATALAGITSSSSPPAPIRQLVDDTETITAVSDWYEAVTRKVKS